MKSNKQNINTVNIGAFIIENKSWYIFMVLKQLTAVEMAKLLDTGLK